jgi:N-methylhydantoinase A/oxoprolinase/acetone carboxylase beta subunit
VSKAVVEKNSSEARKAYGMATANLRANNREEFETLLDQAYAELGLLSPRVKRQQRAAEAAKSKAAAAERREERRLARIEALKAELAALAPGDPLF